MIKNAIIIHVVNGLAFSMVTVFEDFSLSLMLQLLMFLMNHLSAIENGGRNGIYR